MRLAPHYDDVEVFVLQLEGSKSWKLYHPIQNLPREHSGDFDRDELDEPFMELTLQPGDLMYLPRGVIHEARTSNTMVNYTHWRNVVDVWLCSAQLGLCCCVGAPLPLLLCSCTC